ncbi:MAG: response regulator [Proteobacteria bacterium]|nr:response regulator [Pseudomonadota bacterium]
MRAPKFFGECTEHPVGRSMSHSSRITQSFDIDAIIAGQSGDTLSTIMLLIESGEEPRRILQTIVESVAQLPGISSAALYFTNDTSASQQSLLISAGDFPHELFEIPDSPDHILNPNLPASDTERLTTLVSIVCMGAAVGTLAVQTASILGPRTRERLEVLAHHAGVTFERQRLSSTLQHLLDRIQVFNELNQLIVGNIGLQRLVKSLTRDAAFRFAADTSLTLLINDETNTLDVGASYGCAQNLIPKSFGSTTGLLGQVLRVGGYLSVANLSKFSNHGLDFLDTFGIRTVEACCLEVQGQVLGVMLLGFKRETSLAPGERTRLEEFCQGAGVAISNARAQERLTTYTERLEELVESRTADLAVQTARAEEANKAKSQFLANMSHELRTPLTAIVGYGSVLVDGLFGQLNDKQTDALQAIVRSSEHLKTLIDDVLNLARIESGKEEAEPSRVVLRDVLQQTHKLMLQTAIGKGVSILPLDVSESVLSRSIFVDAKHIHQIVINLMSNAVKYTPKGGTVWLSAEPVVDKIKISVHDTGVGISQENILKLFERFERGEDTYSRHQEGTGIGLNLTKELVELNAGRIGCESVLGQGSVFWIMMPMATYEQMSVAQSETPSANLRLDGLSTLVVDDNPDTRDVLTLILTAAGATVRTAQSVREGLAELSKTSVDIVLTDLAMPGESGLVFIEHIRRSSAEVAGLPVIVLSACAFDSDRDAALRAGASLFVPKPFRPSEVIRSVRQLTLGHAMRSSSHSKQVKSGKFAAPTDGIKKEP